ncbi:dyslexia-associated protein KIAA0319 homolog [Boleophthalmus pectinirostris]|uniref:dyslexia-associated protein KIAA0319 homolog n=1 Tax=Boleophthalmus pectinirostris TaxID=150288 RepID=UPI00242E37F8|nr:dyslexia-associated protein KIAA0319 homolog [Boleophthalmus pectinirostris]
MRECVLLLLLLVQVSVESRCWQGPSFSSSVLPPVSLGRSGGLMRVSGAPSLPRCVEAACELAWADVAWLFQGRCYVLSCQQRAQCRPQRRPGAQSHLAFLQRSAPLLPPLYWGEYKSSEDPGDLQTLKDLVLLGSKQDYAEPDLGLMDYTQSNEEIDPTVQLELKEGDRHNQSEAENETTATTEKHREETTLRPLQALEVTQSSLVSLAPPTHANPNRNQETTSPPTLIVMTSLPVVNENLTTSSVNVQSTSETLRTPQPVTESVGNAEEPTTENTNNTTTHSLRTTVSVKAPPSAPAFAPPSVVCSSSPPPTSAGPALLGSAPVAHAGGSYTLILPNNSLLLQGSVTNADPRVVYYLWTRDAQSPAAGDVLFGSESSSSLVLVNLVEGSYLFHLRVTDAWGRSATATATVQVLPEPGGGDEVELELQVSVSQVSVSQRDTLVSQIAALLHVSTSDIQLRRLYGHARLSTVLRFSVQSPPGPVSGPVSVVSLLRSHLLNERTDYLLFRVLRVDTVVCQLQCSSRGQCDPVSRLCLCDPFWTENLLRTYLGDGESNCEWRVLYVILSGFILVLLILSAAWTFMCCCRRKRPSRVRRKTRYTILDNVDEQERVELRPKFSLKHRSTEHNSSLMMSESELSDQDFNRDPPLRNRTKQGLNQV